MIERVMKKGVGGECMENYYIKNFIRSSTISKNDIWRTHTSLPNKNTKKGLLRLLKTFKPVFIFNFKVGKSVLKLNKFLLKPHEESC